MHTDFSLRNFRIFDNEGACIALRPITILTGCNNSGKSSIVKALCLLNDFCNQIKTDIKDGRSLRFEDYKFDFQKFPNSLLGNFDMVRHRKPITKREKQGETDIESNESSNKRIVFEAVVKSSWLLQDVILRLEFGSLEWDELNNGYLYAYSIRTLDGDIIYESRREGKTTMDFSIVKKSLLHFLCGQYAFTQWQEHVVFKMATEGVKNSYLKDKEKNRFIEITNNILNDLGPTALVYLAEWQVLHYKEREKENRTLLKGGREVSFIPNAPSLGVYCYWPCLDYFKDMDKTTIIHTIKEKIDVSAESITPNERSIINIILTFFEKSPVASLHEFIGQLENKRYFVDAVDGENGFQYPDIFNNAEIYADYFKDPDMLEEPHWGAVLLSMDLINKLVMGTSETYLDNDKLFYDDEYYDEVPTYKYEDELNNFMKQAIDDIFQHLLPGSLSYSPTTIVRPQRMYSLEDNSDFSNTLKEYFEVKRLWAESSYKDQYIPCSFINKWMSLLGVAHHIEIKSHAGGYGVTIHLYDTENTETEVLLADKGVGVLQLFAILLKIECAIIAMKINENRNSYSTIGLSNDFIKSLRGYSQLYPTTVALEEPECHLHPSLQSRLADVFAEAYKQYGVHFLIESHSEYLIRKLQLNVAKGEIHHNDVSLIYVNSPSRPTFMPVITDIGVDTDGALKNEFGQGFFDESIRLSNELFKIKVESDDEEQA